MHTGRLQLEDSPFNCLEPFTLSIIHTIVSSTSAGLDALQMLDRESFVLQEQPSEIPWTGEVVSGM